MKGLIALVVVWLGEALGTNTIIFGPGFPSRFACSSDAYEVQKSGFKLPADLITKVEQAELVVTRYIEPSEEVGLERELVESSLRLFDESKVLKVGLVYMSIEYELQKYIAKDYIAAQVALSSLNTLKGTKYIINALRAFAKSNWTKYKDKKTEEAKYGLCSMIVYSKIADKLEIQRSRQLGKIKLESKRITQNLSQLGRVKSTGNIWLLTSGARFSGILTTVLLLSLSIYNMI